MPSSVPTPPLSPRQREVRDAIADFTRRRGYSPSLREIANAVGVSRTRAAHVCREAARRGAIEHDHGVARSWRVVVQPKGRRSRGR